eukprot:Sspe_Gene.27643::Locus_12016_Transcript_1_1_Confidence_1.000_Length_7586::g.27643::m.27643
MLVGEDAPSGTPPKARSTSFHSTTGQWRGCEHADATLISFRRAPAAKGIPLRGEGWRRGCTWLAMVPSPPFAPRLRRYPFPVLLSTPMERKGLRRAGIHLPAVKGCLGEERRGWGGLGRLFTLTPIENGVYMHPPSPPIPPPTISDWRPLKQCLQDMEKCGSPPHPPLPSPLNTGGLSSPPSDCAPNTNRVEVFQASSTTWGD